MSLHKIPELKEAVLSLPNKEKDKLLIRLIGKDKMLIKQLHFELLEDSSDLEDRIIKLRNDIESFFKLIEDNVSDVPIYRNYKTLNSMLKQASGYVNEHEKVTKDKFSVVEFRLLILRKSFERFPHLFEPSGIETALKLRKYITGRIKNAVGIYEKLHEDLQFDLQDSMEFVLTFAQENRIDIP